jgi:hypothetical protein
VVTIAADAALRLARHKRRAHFFELAHRGVDSQIASWPEFHAAMADRPLLAKLDDYRDALLIAGCDRSAVTAITYLFKRLPEFADSSWSHNEELDDALLLAGLRADGTGGRHCFQTTYLGERYREYLAHDRFKLVWIVREPRAAVRSLLAGRERDRLRAAHQPADTAGQGGSSRLEKACASYIANMRQGIELKERLGDRVAVLDYDELSANRDRLLPALCRFAAVDYDASLLRFLHGKSARKGTLASFEAAIVDRRAMQVYRRARCAATLSVAHG